MRKILLVSLLLVVLSVLYRVQTGTLSTAFAQELSPTPTYDPLAEPALPSNPTEFEFGRHLYWNWCMTCHGDRGQGLTDEWRAVWVEDHQDCWARGCHAGRTGDLGFPIPTVVPQIIGDGHLAQFDALQDLIDFLKATHPPQKPGTLLDTEYHAIAAYVFTLNDRSLAPPAPEPTLAPTLLALVPSTPMPERLLPSSARNQWFVVILAIIILVVSVLLLRRGRVLKK